jgi:hypothetical protein
VHPFCFWPENDVAGRHFAKEAMEKEIQGAYFAAWRRQKEEIDALYLAKMANPSKR